MYRPPDFQPLERALAAHFGDAAGSITPAFWFIGYAAGPDDVGELRIYEHSVTHARVALDRHGRAFCWYAEVCAFGRLPVDDAWIDALLEPSMA